MTTTTEFAELIEAERAAWKAIEQGGSPAAAAAATQAVLDARPTDPATMAAQLRWICALDGALGADQNGPLLAIAARLEAAEGGTS